MQLPGAADLANTLLPLMPRGRRAPMSDLSPYSLPLDVVQYNEFVGWRLPCILKEFRGHHLKRYDVRFARVLCSYLGFDRYHAIFGMRGERAPIREISTGEREKNRLHTDTLRLSVSAERPQREGLPPLGYASYAWLSKKKLGLRRNTWETRNSEIPQPPVFRHLRANYPLPLASPFTWRPQLIATQRIRRRAYVVGLHVQGIETGGGTPATPARNECATFLQQDRSVDRCARAAHDHDQHARVASNRVLPHRLVSTVYSTFRVHDLVELDHPSREERFTPLKVELPHPAELLAIRVSQ